MTDIKLFEEKRVRSVWNEPDQKWYFAVVDVVAVLTEQDDFQKARKYWNKLKERLAAEAFQPVTICHQFKLLAADGKNRLTDCANIEGMLRIIQSIPSPKAEPFKRWLAQVGAERLAEIENPELATQRARTLYEQKGYSPEWIEKRMRGIAIRDELTHEWKERGVKEGKEYAILTAEISKATFGLTPSEYKDLKSLHKPSENLRDHMSDLELIFTMLGEASTTEIARKKNAQGFPQNKQAAQAGGTIAGNARKELEAQSGMPVVTGQNNKRLSKKAEIARLRGLE